MKTALLLLAAWLCGAAAFAQNSLQGKVTDADTGKPVIVILHEVVVTEYKVPLVEQDICNSVCNLTSKQIRSLPTRNLNALVSATTACRSGLNSAESNDGQQITMRSCRGCDYYVDGVRVSPDNRLPEEEVSAEGARTTAPVRPQPSALPARAKCYPNPTAGPFYLQLPTDIRRLVIHNLEGRLILEQGNLSQGDHEFNANGWAPGLYLLELHQGDEVAVEKLVVERRP